MRRANNHQTSLGEGQDWTGGDPRFNQRRDTTGFDRNGADGGRRGEGTDLRDNRKALAQTKKTKKDDVVKGASREFGTKLENTD